MKKIITKPWGNYTVLSKGNNFLLKKLIVKPGQILSYQSHQYRSEHWVIISGKATVIINDKNHYICKNENIFIPQRAKHRVLNESKTKNLILIEVQTGTKFLESDIKRYSDIYGRLK
jgi:mannose-6-phosphate isomerase-like protein (cupin superfamily)|tara:strand:- start:116 stop:466 length:351 start_codon:yes stop_codon:yes gene_type:complete